MKKYLIALLACLVLAGCSPAREVVQIIQGAPGANGADGSSCSVSQAENGALLSCTDGSAVLILNGHNGANGINGTNGLNGQDGDSCYVQRLPHRDYVTVTCGNSSQRVYDGVDGRDGQDGSDGRDGADGIGCTITSMSAAQLSPAGGAKVSCGGSHGNTVFIKNGSNGTNGSNGAQGVPGAPCTSSKSGVTLTISCPGSLPLTITDGHQGAQGIAGPQGPVGPVGPQGQSYQPALGLVCQVYDLPGDTGQNRSLPAAFLGATPKFVKVVSQLNVGDTQSSAGFPFLSAAEKALIGTDGYAFDCAGYLDVPTTGDYTFNLMSDDGARLAIEDNEIINNDGLHAPSELSGSHFLYKGKNRINVQYYQGPNTQIALKLDWAGPNFTRVNVPSASFSN